MTPKTRRFMTAVLALCAGIGGYSFFQLHSIAQTDRPAPKPSVSAESLIGQPRPDFTLYDINANLRDLKEWDGQVIVLNFWGTWCPPCLKEIPDLNAFHKDYKDKNVALIGIAHDTAAKVAEFKEKMEMEYTQLYDPLLAVELSKAYGNELGALPYTVIIDKNGVIRYIHKQGIINQAELSHLVDKWL